MHYTISASGKSNNNIIASYSSVGDFAAVIGNTLNTLLNCARDFCITAMLHKLLIFHTCVAKRRSQIAVDYCLVQGNTPEDTRIPFTIICL